MPSTWPRKSTARFISSPPGFAHFVSLRHPPCRGQYRRPGKAGSTVFPEGAGQAGPDFFSRS
ncbi:MAG: hypothetical protein EOP79_14620 [Variovorax sp.]|nr:MAG: hypothetical protein EOP79_14620 [Variovorax sp.]